jgi:hypothetical protein
MHRWYQDRVTRWLKACFGDSVATDRTERSHRFLEEALELVQACGCTEAEARQLVRYVYSRPEGEVKQEVGGVAVTLAALCHAQGIDLETASWAEVERIEQPEIMKRIRVKQATKPKVGPLPEYQYNGGMRTGG